MPLFIKPRDYAFFQSINKELVDEIIETAIILYSIDRNATDSNLYGESTTKVFKPGIKVNALIDNDDEMNVQDDGFGPNIYQNILVAVHRETLKEKDFYPERGDYALWNGAYFEINGTVDNQLIAGRHFQSIDDEGLPHSIVFSATMVSADSINVRDES